jgi:hypothetical protein
VFLTRGGNSALLVRRGSAVNGIAAGVVLNQWFQNSEISDFGDLATFISVSGSGVNEDNDTALIVARPASVRSIARESDRAPGAPNNAEFGHLSLGGSTFPFRGRPVMNRRGEVAFESNIIANDGLYRESGLWTTVGGDLRAVAIRQERVPGVDPSYWMYSTTPIGVTDRATYFLGEYRDQGQTFTREAIFVDTDGTTRMLIQEGDPAPEMPAGVTIEGFTKMFVNQAGQLAFQGLLTGPGIPFDRRQAVYAQDRAGAWRLILREAETVRTPTGTEMSVRGLAVDSYEGGPTNIAFSDMGHVSMYAGLTTGGQNTSASVVVSSDVAAQLILPSDAQWKYDASGADRGTAWRQPTFDDSAWSLGSGFLGYGETHVDTVIPFGGNPVARHPTSYFRTTFEIADATALDAVTLELLADDGAAVYLNGTRIARDNLAPGARYSDYALSESANEKAYKAFAVDPRLLRNGANVLAVEVHQASASNPDLIFAARLFTGPIPLVFAPEFGTAPPNLSASFEEASPGALALVAATEPRAAELGFRATEGQVERLTGGSPANNQVFALRNASTVLKSELVDLRGFRGATVSVDMRTWEDSTGSDFETDDFVRLMAEFSYDGVTFSTLDITPIIDGGASTGDPTDGLKALDRGQFGAFTTFAASLPAGVRAARVVIRASNNSASERFYFDNVRVDAVPVPEPSTIVLSAIAAICFIWHRIATHGIACGATLRANPRTRCCGRSPDRATGSGIGS